MPPAFVDQMRALLGDEAEEFLAASQRPRSRGLRANGSRISLAELALVLGVDLAPLPWCGDGAVLAPGQLDDLGRHPAHLAGLCYIQEPSSMATATALAPEAGWRVADLAAAPGGKTTQLAALVGPDGLVVANEVVGSRLRPLHDNLDRWGSANVVTTSLALDRFGPLAASLVGAPDGNHGPGGFDGVVLDAPCSGEALFRRDPAAAHHWSPAAVAGAARRQGELLMAAAPLVRPGGVLVYSTCTFNRAEDEDQLVALVAADGRWTIEDLGWLGADPGLVSPGVATERAARLWPHRAPGEGQFVARLRRAETADGNSPARSRGATSRRKPDRSRRPDGRGRDGGIPGPPDRAILEAWRSFQDQAAPGLEIDESQLVVRHEWLFAVPRAGLPLVAAGGAAIQRPGLPLGRARPGRFEPHAALATALDPAQAGATVSWADGQPELAAYLRGETLADPGPDGWVLVCYRGWGLGWVRRRQNVLKNAFPPQLRRQAAGLAPSRR